jgi:hypothetical protein
VARNSIGAVDRNLRGRGIDLGSSRCLTAFNGFHLSGVGPVGVWRIRYRSGRQHIAPLLVGKMPDYVVLIFTLGGLAAFGLNGFVIGPVIAAMFIAAWDIFSESASVDSGED